MDERADERADEAEAVAEETAEPADEAALEAALEAPEAALEAALDAALAAEPVVVDSVDPPEAVAEVRADDSTPRAPVETADADAPLADAATPSWRSVEWGSRRSRELTGAIASSVGDDFGGIPGIATSLVGAVTNAVAEVCIGAVADYVTRFAAKLGLGNGEHVADAGLLGGG